MKNRPRLAYCRAEGLVNIYIYIYIYQCQQFWYILPNHYKLFSFNKTLGAYSLTTFAYIFIKIKKDTLHIVELLLLPFGKINNKSHLFKFISLLHYMYHWFTPAIKKKWHIFYIYSVIALDRWDINNLVLMWILFLVFSSEWIKKVNISIEVAFWYDFKQSSPVHHSCLHILWIFHRSWKNF